MSRPSHPHPHRRHHFILLLRTKSQHSRSAAPTPDLRKATETTATIERPSQKVCERTKEPNAERSASTSTHRVPQKRCLRLGDPTSWLPPFTQPCTRLYEVLCTQFKSPFFRPNDQTLSSVHLSPSSICRAAALRHEESISSPRKK